MPVQETSLEAYEKVKPHLNAKQIVVRNFYRRHPNEDFTNAEVAHELGWTINRITPRTGELVKLGELKITRRRVCRITGNMALAKKYVEW